MLGVNEIKSFSNDILLEHYELKLKEIDERKGSGTIMSKTLLTETARLKKEIENRTKGAKP